MQNVEQSNFKLTEYVYYHAGINEFMVLFAAPTAGIELYDLEVAGEFILTDLVYVGEL